MDTDRQTHTPGPWHVGTRQAGIIVYDAKGWAICDCKVYHGDADQSPKANAALIARAPDLLAENARLRAALRNLICAADELTDGQLSNDCASEREFFVALDEARAALAGEVTP